MTRVLLVPDLPVERWPSMDRYASRLASQLPAVASDLEFAVAGDIADLTDEQARPHRRGASAATRSRTPADEPGELGRYLARYWRYPRRVRRMAGDVLHVLDHSYAHMVPARGTRPSVVTVHDLLPLMTLQEPTRSLRGRIRNRWLMRVVNGLARADAWIVGTGWLSTELAAWLGSGKRIHVVPFGLDESFHRPAIQPRAEARARWSIPSEAFVVLHVGSTGPRKNIAAVIETVAGLRQRGIEAWLLQVGGHFTTEQRRRVAAQGLEGYVKTLGPALEQDLRTAYGLADALLFPSHYEGFGFPVLEAMASGVPVVASDAGGLREVAAEAAVVIPSREPAPYIDALVGIAEEPARRRTLVQRGRDRARQFTWAETARKTAEVYRSLV